MGSAQAVPRGGSPWRLSGLVLLVLVLAPLVVARTFLLYIATLVLLYSIGAMSLHLVLRMGYVSLGHAAFMGVGGYTSALLVRSLHLPWSVAFLASGAGAALLALLVGPIILRLKGVYFVLVTFTLGEIVRLVFVEWEQVTNGSNGIAEIPAPWVAVSGVADYYYVALGAALLVLIFVSRVLASDVGHAVEAIRENETLAEANGIPVLRVKVTLFTIACGLVGLQGSLQAHFIHFISPLSYSFSESLNFVVINVIGGLHTLWGPLIGAAFLVSLPELLRSWLSAQWMLYGLALVLVMAYFPGGLGEIGSRIARFARHRQRAA